MAAAIVSCHSQCCSSTLVSSRRLSPRIPTNYLSCLRTESPNAAVSPRRFGPRCSSGSNKKWQPGNQEKGGLSSLKECAISLALAVGLVAGDPSLSPSTGIAYAAAPALPDLAVLISGPPIKDPEALLRYALPINNKAIREVQKPLEDITDSLKVAGLKALDSVERNVRQASRALKQGKSLILAGLAESKKDHGVQLLEKLEAGMDELQQIVEDRNRDAVAPKQKELLQYVGGSVF
ncbi:hypothetical protein CRG98_030153 [Punica granatum]|uniref:peptidylprolyl isomerase n=1 Tax=Punica granatum TaxID=22663 RepID=A0A2I0IZN5_PUNGR|nr:hypothetical protein CRG98_030153 [Punica granatum]